MKGPEQVLKQQEGLGLAGTRGESERQAREVQVLPFPKCLSSECTQPGDTGHTGSRDNAELSAVVWASKELNLSEERSGEDKAAYNSELVAQA